MSYINKASSGASDDASLDAFYVQSVQGGASRSADRGRASKSARDCMPRWKIGAGWIQELVNLMELPELQGT